MLSAKELLHVSWECVHFVHEGQIREVRPAIESVDTFYIEGDAAEVSSKESLLDLLADILKFPEYFGCNWDALEECLRDMEWLPAKGYVVVLHSAEKLWRENAQLAGALVESWLFCAEEWGRAGISFHLVFVW